VILSTNNNCGAFSLNSCSNVDLFGNRIFLNSTNGLGFAVSGTTNSPSIGIRINNNWCDTDSAAVALSSFPIGYSGVTSDVSLWDNSWMKHVYRQDQNSNTVFQVANYDSRTNTVGAAVFDMEAYGAGGYLAAYGRTYNDPTRTNRLILGNNN